MSKEVKRTYRYQKPFSRTRIRNLQRKINYFVNLGYSDSEIARKLKITKQSFHNLKKSMSSWEEVADDLYIHQGSRRYAKHERLRNAHVILRSGLSIKSAMWLFGRSYNTIRAWIREYEETQQNKS